MTATHKYIDEFHKPNVELKKKKPSQERTLIA